MIFRPVFRYIHKRAIRILRSSVDIMIEQERGDPDGFATTGMVLPVLLMSLRDKCKRPIDVILRPDDLTFRQRADIIRTIDDEARRMDGILKEDPEDDSAYYSRVCLNWLEILHQAYFRVADMPDVVPEMALQLRDDVSELVFRALDKGENKLAALNAVPDTSQTLH